MSKSKIFLLDFKDKQILLKSDFPNVLNSFMFSLYIFNPNPVMSAFTWFKHNSGGWICGGTSQTPGILNSRELDLPLQKC